MLNMKLYGGSGKGRNNKKPEIFIDEELSASDEEGLLLSEADIEQSGGTELTETAAAEEQEAEEQEDIDKIISEYQKYKKGKRIAAVAVILTVLVCGFYLYKAFIRPPEVEDTNVGRNKPSVNKPVNTPKPDAGAAETDTPEEVELKAGERIKGMYTLLLVGLDQQYSNTDTLMICRFDTVNTKISIVSIPRDICANVEYETKKINAVYALGHGIDALVNAVSDMTGFKIDNYILVNIKAFVALVNTIGGVYYDVPYYMDWDDPTQDLHIHYNKGYQYLNGYDALNVVRWRQNNDNTVYGDIVRIENQQKFLIAVLKQCLSISNIFTKTDDYVKIFNEYVKTDLDIGNLGWFAQKFLKLKVEDLEFATMPANYNASIKGFSYGLVHVDEWIAMVNRYLNPFDKEITADDVSLIAQDDNGNIYSTTGEIAGGYESFLSYDEYMERLRAESEAKAEAERIKAEAEQAQNPAATEVPSAADTPAETDSSGAEAAVPDDSAGDISQTDESPAATDYGLFYTGDD